MNAVGCLLVMLSMAAAAPMNETTFGSSFMIEAMTGCDDYIYLWGSGKISEILMLPGEEPKLIVEREIPQITTTPSIRCESDSVLLSSPSIILLLDPVNLSVQMEYLISNVIDSVVTPLTISALLSNSSIAVWNITSPTSDPIIINSPVENPQYISPWLDYFLVANTTTVSIVSFSGMVSDGEMSSELSVNLEMINDVIAQPNRTSAYHISTSSVLTFIDDIEQRESWTVQLMNGSSQETIIKSAGSRLVVAQDSSIMVYQGGSPSQLLYQMDLPEYVSGIVFLSSIGEFLYSSDSWINQVVKKDVTDAPRITLVPVTGVPETAAPDSPAPVVERSTSAADESHLAWVIPVVVVSVLVVIVVIYLLYRRFYGGSEAGHVTEPLLNDNRLSNKSIQELSHSSDMRYVGGDTAPKAGGGMPITEGLGYPPVHAPVEMMRNTSGVSTPVGTPIPRGALLQERDQDQGAVRTFNNPTPNIGIQQTNNPLTVTTTAPQNCYIVDTETGAIITSPTKSIAAATANATSNGPLFSAAMSSPRPELPVPSLYSQSVLSTPSQVSGPPLTLTRQQFVNPPKAVLEDLVCE